MSSTPPGLRLYAIGDIHGRHDLLEALLPGLTEEAEGEAGARFVFLGDYVDRGPDSRKVVESLRSFAAPRAEHVVFLKGNHDDTLLKFTHDASVGRTWRRFGGVETLVSYGVAPPGDPADDDAWERARQAFVEALGPSHLEFFRSLKDAAVFGDYFFAHAGVRPGVPLDQQDREDLYWIREEFLRNKTYLGRVIVHGHTPEREAHSSAVRIGVDTGAYASGRLTAVVLDGAERRFIEANLQGGRPALRHIRMVTGDVLNLD